MGMNGVRQLETAVKEFGFVGAHVYPHWFELPPNNAKYYPFYANVSSSVSRSKCR